MMGSLRCFYQKIINTMQACLIMKNSPCTQTESSSRSFNARRSRFETCRTETYRTIRSSEITAKHALSGTDFVNRPLGDVWTLLPGGFLQSLASYRAVGSVEASKPPAGPGTGPIL